MSVLFFYVKGKGEAKNWRLPGFYWRKASQWFFSCDEGENSWKLFENSICEADAYGVEDENFSEFLGESICNKDF